MTKYRSVVCYFLHNKKEEEEEEEGGRWVDCLSSYNLNIIDGFTDMY